ncbi:MAG TPA: alpha/beta hydrolase, partial [Caulobacteraceae bacterium]|nr:alpha/beta hydrolase [Caulobacteraceae bacterium]
MSTSSVQTPRNTALAPPPVGTFHEIGGRRLLLHRSGARGPAVVFLPGAGLVGLDYLNIHGEVSRFTTSVLYDRAGTGWSDEVRLPRTAAEVTDELHGLLVDACVPPPYVLVGHSLGGAYARRYAQRFAADVAGILLLDAAHEDFYEHVPSPKLKLAEQWRQGWALLPVLLDLRRFYRPMFERMLRTWPEPVRATLIEYHLRSWRKSLQEGRNLRTEIFDELRQGGDTRDVPLI